MRVAMAEIINLRQARKARKRTDSERLAGENRARHGRTKGEKHLVDVTRQKFDEALDGARREPIED